MSINWSRYLSLYQQKHGGCFFDGPDGSYHDNHLVLSEGEKYPILVFFDAEPMGKSQEPRLRARALVKLNKPYELRVGAKNAAVAGVNSVLSAVGAEDDYGYPELTRGRMISTDNEPFTKLVLGDLSLRNGLLQHKDAWLRIAPASCGGGTHTVEIGTVKFNDGLLTYKSPWINEAMRRGEGFSPNRDADIQEGSEHFNRTMNEFLELLRAACRAVTTWNL